MKRAEAEERKARFEEQKARVDERAAAAEECRRLLPTMEDPTLKAEMLKNMNEHFKRLLMEAGMSPG